MVLLAFILSGFVILLGFIGNYLFKKTGIPDILILVLLGWLVGPFFKMVDPSVLATFSQFFISLALLLILFDGGLNLNINRVFRESPRAFALAILGFSITVLITAVFCRFLLGWDLIYGVLFGVIIGGSSSSIVIPIISRIKISPKISTLLSLESTFTDAIVVVSGITLIQLLVANVSGNSLYIFAQGIANAFSTGAMLGILVGIIWLRVLKYVQGEIYDDVLTLAIALLFYGVVESLGGNGAIFALMFGLILGNGKEISEFLKMKDCVQANQIMKKFHSQMSFLIRSFFFVYIGMILTVYSNLTFYYGILLTLLLVLGRYFVSFMISSRENDLRNYRGVITLMLPRGLAAAVVAQLIVSYGILHSQEISDLTITIIVSTVVVAAVGASLIRLKTLKEEKEVKKENNKSRNNKNSEQ